MKDFEFYKTIRFSKSEDIQKIFSKLYNLYHQIPKTKGCMENNILDKGKGCNSWCCRFQSPQLLYSEFLLIWKYISKNWIDENICDLIEKCMMNSVNDIPSKECVFFDEETNLCRCHKQRPFNCRIYGITPEEEFRSRYEKLKEEYKDIIGAVVRPQCELVSTCNGEDVSVYDTDKWWDELVKIEKSIGIPSKLITDKMGGSYRSPHDHVLLYSMPENVLNALAGIKMYKEFSDKIKGVKEIVSYIRNYFKGTSKE